MLTRSPVTQRLIDYYHTYYNIPNAVTTAMDISEQIEASHVTLTLQWSTINGVTYAINIDPQVAVNYTGRNTAQLRVFYNIIYNISIMASLCGTNRTTFCVIKYGKQK